MSPKHYKSGAPMFWLDLTFQFFCLEATLGEDTQMRATSFFGIFFRKCHSEGFLITTKLTFLLNNCKITLTTAFWKTSYSWRFYGYGSRYMLIRSYAFFIRTSKVLSLKMFLLYLNFHETFFPVNGDFC